MSAPRDLPVASCDRCGQPGNEPPGLRVEEYRSLQAVWVEDTPLIGDDLPVRLVCNSCGYAKPVRRGSIVVRKP